MPTLPRPLFAMLALLYAMAALVGTASAAQAQEGLRILVFSKTAGFRHDSIGAGIAAVQALGTQHGFTVDASEDAAVFTDKTLAAYDAVVWLNTTGDVLDATQQIAFADYMLAGGGYVGVHAAADTEYDWPLYGDLLAGAWFASHPAIQSAQVQREHATHPSTAALPAAFDIAEEWYNFRANPRAHATVLLTLDESSYTPGAGAMGDDHPIAWYRHLGAGRAFYTGLGHCSETFADARFVEHLRGGILWAAGATSLFVDGFELPAQGVLRATPPLAVHFPDGCTVQLNPRTPSSGD